MDFNATLDIIINDLKEAREIIDDLKNYPGIPQLQVELAKSKCRSAEEIISLLKSDPAFREGQASGKRDSTHEEPQGKGKTDNAGEQDNEEPAELIGMTIIESEPEAEVSVEDIPETDVIGEASAPEQKELFEITEEDTAVSPAAPGAKVKEKKEDKPIIADRFSKVSNIVDEQIGTHRRDDDISSVLKTKPVSNLKDAIGLNDKFLYIRELFDGNQARYEEAITRLNNSATLDDARSVIFSYVGEEEENEVVVQLLDLVKRKLMTDG